MRDVFSDIVPFVAVAEEGSFRGAARRLGVTPAAMSKAIARLEDEVGARLLNRTTRRVSLSPEGELLLPRCQEAVALVESGRERVSSAHTEASGELVLSLPYVLSGPLVRRLPRLLERYPNLHLSLRFTDRFSRLVDEGIDVAVRIGELADSSLVARRLMRARWCTVAAPAYLAERGRPASPESLEGHQMLAFRSPQGRPVPWSFRASARSDELLSVAPRGSLDTDQGVELVAAAEAGLGVAQVFAHMVVEQLREGRLVELFADRAAPGPPVHALRLAGQTETARIRVLLDFLVECFGEAEAAVGSR